MEPSTSASRLALAVVSCCFAVIIASVNLINPLLPELQRSQGLSAAVTAGLYSVYLVVLVVVLAGLSWRPPAWSARKVLLAALACTGGADLCHVLGGLPAIALGRALLSLGVGLGTAAVARLAIDLSAGRTTSVTATANVTGALVGTASGGAVLHLSQTPVFHGFLGHALIVAVLFPVTALSVPATAIHGVPRDEPERRSPAGRRDHRRRRTVGGLVLGSVSWAAAGSVIVIAPAAVQAAGGDAGSWVTSTVLAMFAAAFWSQHTVGRTARALPALGCTLTVAMAAVTTGVMLAESWLLLAGGVLVGLAYGAVLRIGLQVVAGLGDAVERARRTTVYAGTSYLAAGVTMTVAGFVVDRLGGGTALLLVATEVICGLVVALFGLRGATKVGLWESTVRSPRLVVGAGACDHAGSMSSERADFGAVENRVHAVEGSHNVRDLGGLATSDGRRIRTGRVFRSDYPTFLSADPAPGVALTEIATVVDLRRGTEVVVECVDWAARGVTYRRWPLTAGHEDSWHARYTAYLSLRPETVVGAVREAMRPEGHPVLFHCAAGKDRTGVVAALLLSLLGVEEDDIVDDYMLSTSSVEAVIERLVGMDVYAAMLADSSIDDQMPRPEHIRGLLEWLDDRGGAEAWLMREGVPAAELAAFRAAMLED